MKLSFATAAALAVISAAPAYAGTSFLGDTLDGAYYFPDLSTVYVDDGLKVVSPTATFSLFTGGSTSTALVSGDQITVTLDTTVSKTTAAFNGIVITDTTSAQITDAVLDASSIGPAPVVTFTSDSVDINLQGLTLNSSDKIIVDVSFNGAPFAGAPEPAIWGLMLVGFAGLGAALRSRRRLLTA